LRNVGLAAQAAAAAALYFVSLWLWAWATGRELTYRGHFDPDLLDPALSLLPLLQLFPLLGLLVLHARRKGHRAAAIGAALVRQPSWWVGPYPRGARGPGDVWDRLPSHLRMARSLLLAALPVVWYFLLMTAIDDTGLEQYQRFGSRRPLPTLLHEHDGVIVHPLLAYVIAAGASVLTSFRRLRRGPLAGLEPTDIFPAFVRSTADSRFWARPVYAGLLAPRSAAGHGTTATRTETAMSGPEEVTSTRPPGADG
jgi:hypothetical protein